MKITFKQKGVSATHGVEILYEDGTILKSKHICDRVSDLFIDAMLELIRLSIADIDKHSEHYIVKIRLEEYKPSANEPKSLGEFHATDLVEWYESAHLGYKPLSMMWQAYRLADTLEFTLLALNDLKNGDYILAELTRRICETYKDNYFIMTELDMVLNHSLWFWHDENIEVRRVLGVQYDKLWRDVHDYLCDTLEGEAARYHFQITD